MMRARVLAVVSLVLLVVSLRVPWVTYGPPVNQRIGVEFYWTNRHGWLGAAVVLDAVLILVSILVAMTSQPGVRSGAGEPAIGLAAALGGALVWTSLPNDFIFAWWQDPTYGFVDTLLRPGRDLGMYLFLGASVCALLAVLIAWSGSESRGDARVRVPVAGPL